MAKARGDFADILLKKKMLSPDQLADAENYAGSMGLKLQDAIIKKEYLTANEVMSSIAEFYNMKFVDLAEITIHKSVIQLVPESVARENVVIPLQLEDNTLELITADPTNYDTVQKLQFILNKQTRPALAAQEQIQDAINRNHGQTETNCVDS